jgi:tyrosinase
MPIPVTSTALAVAGLDRDFNRADIQFHDLDHSGASYEGRVFLNNPAADERTARVPESGYAGSFHIFGHGGCLGDPGHCDVVPRRPHDPRPAHPLTPARKLVVATEAVRRAMDGGTEITVTVVPVVLSTTPAAGRPDDLVRFEQVRIVTYR